MTMKLRVATENAFREMLSAIVAQIVLIHPTRRRVTLDVHHVNSDATMVVASINTPSVMDETIVATIPMKVNVQ